MSCFRIFGIGIVLLISWTTVASACSRRHKLDYADVKDAEAIVVGHIEDYQLVADQAAQDGYRATLDQSSTLPPTFDENIPVAAHFDIVVDEVLRGSVGRRLQISWSGGNYQLPPTLAPGPYFIALTDTSYPFSNMPGFNMAKTGKLTVLQPLCTRAFLFPADSKDAESTTRALRER
ncbi:hypothetical protein [Rhizobium tubonense]|uniref:Uncharacterized protein n=1 Tax=Rhizobium tubonense TaxID=484088 RepID=A0A2W4CR06_9HYPH|nr:hypothetical protein [Rhizobium tubonense]PZM07864.1 hypothetical protein CPY51_30610 [Rhizobium tubonense]